MSLVVQNDEGTAEGANAYLSVADFKAYHDDRGNDYSGSDDAAIGAAIIKATDYVDGRFRYVGRKANGFAQSTEWPRLEAYDPDDDSIDGVPTAVKEACAEYAFRALSAELAPDPEQSATGVRVQSTTTKVGVIEESITYAGDGATLGPSYPMADMKLRRAGLVRSSLVGTVHRA